VDRQALHLEGNAAGDLHPAVHVFADQVARSIVIPDVEYDDGLVDVFEETTNLILHPRAAEAAANAQVDAVLPHDRAHGTEHRRLFAPKFDVVRLFADEINPVFQWLTSGAESGVRSGDHMLDLLRCFSTGGFPADLRRNIDAVKCF